MESPSTNVKYLCCGRQRKNVFLTKSHELDNIFSFYTDEIKRLFEILSIYEHETRSFQSKTAMLLLWMNKFTA